MVFSVTSSNSCCKKEGSGRCQVQPSSADSHCELRMMHLQEIMYRLSCILHRVHSRHGSCDDTSDCFQGKGSQKNVIKTFKHFPNSESLISLLERVLWQYCFFFVNLFVFLESHDYFPLYKCHADQMKFLWTTKFFSATAKRFNI